MGLEVIRPGVLSLLQDLGRYGQAMTGLSQGGPMDLHAHAWANHLLENDPNAAVLEIAIGQASFRAVAPVQISLTGATMQARINNDWVGNWRCLSLERGDELTLGAATSGFRAYLAISGGIEAPLMKGSASVVLRNGIGTPLEKGDVLNRGLAPAGMPTFIPPKYIPSYDRPCVLRVIPSLQEAAFDDTLFRSVYKLLPKSDRMGACFSGARIGCRIEGVISEGIPLGAIQVPPDGQPIVLMNDRQTLGGYPKAGCVARIDLPKLGQLRPGNLVRFEAAEIGEMREKWQEFARFFGLS